MVSELGKRYAIPMHREKGEAAFENNKSWGLEKAKLGQLGRGEDEYIRLGAGGPREG
ncbi:hypothetical protein N9L68_05575 [bacterium]|nr:hypothetical protein [bacterium]